MEKRVLIMAGGTGGHVFPGLALAFALRGHGVDIHWLGTKRGLEASQVPAAKIPISFLSIQGLRGKRFGLLFAPWRISRALWQAISVMRKVKPNLVIGMGGFASGPGGIAARLLGIPLVIHEQNAIAGMTNRILAKFATRIFEAFPDAFAKRKNVVFSGNPVRNKISAVPNPNARYVEHQGPLRVLVIGGSQGASAFNEYLPGLFASVDDPKSVMVWHQSGLKGLEKTRVYYASADVSARIDAFIDDMGEAYKWADLVICRAGATTVSELMTVGVAAIMIPFPFAVDDHQAKNAQYLVDHAAGMTVRQEELESKRLLTQLNVMIAAGREELLPMAQAAQALSQPLACEKIALACLEICCEQRSQRQKHPIL